ncbi:MULTISPECIES: AAA family ATPase [Bradyrhizobium]|uniref:AAA family ATPase n=1 Tax=Bradyrhizobium TaxID=374 RepID=UPI000417F83B|nr:MULTISPECIES: AAA family ATPase [Bradyrhizobium]QOG19033.1 AAA family ATPase [Bradyrhizobium sp. SEMIA]UFW48499.1 AAA family ATPase [Bradyrhizobium arachidis]
MNIAGDLRPLVGLADSGLDAQTKSLLQLRDFLRREWRLIAFVTIFSSALGATYVGFAPRKFTAQTDMFVDTKGITAPQSETSQETRGVDDSIVESEIETTKSEKVGKSVIRRLHLTEDPEFVGPAHGLLGRAAGLFGLATKSDERLSPAELERRALANLNDNLRVTRLGRSYVEQIAYTSLDPDKAARIANAFADAYIEYRLQAKYEATRRASAWLEERISELRQQASNAYKAVQDFKAENGIIIGVEGKLASEVELDQLGVALAKARADTSQARAKLDRIQLILEQRPEKENFAIPDPVVTDALNSQVITKLRQKFLENQNRQAEWSVRYGPDHEAVKNLRSEMAALQRSIWDEISRIAESYKSELQIAKSQEDAIDKRMLEIFQQSGSTRQAQVRLRELETGANTYRGIYEAFLSRFTQSVQQQSFPSTEARVVTEASAPSKPSSPKVGITLAFAMMCGLGLGALSAIAREQFMHRRVHTRDQLETLLGTSCLAAFPQLSRLKARLRGRSSAFRQINEAPPFSATAEALRYIKVAIDLYPGEAKVIGITSALPGEGKTTVAAAVAAFLAKTGARTLVIDSDLRSPALSQTLGYIDERGLQKMAAEGLAVADVVIPDPNFRFDVIPSPATARPSNSSDVLSAPSIRKELERARQDYDYILCDLPPILPIVDVKAVAGLFDAFIMVVEWGNSTDEVLKAVRSSPLLSERLIGAVLNKTDETFMRRFEGYSDRRYAYYTK